jgi:hypothetical protein
MSRYPFASSNACGTIGFMSDHRVRLNDRELALVVAALRARIAGLGEERANEVAKLANRLSEGKPGNPTWILQEPDYHDLEVTYGGH